MRRLTAGLVLGSLALAACGGGDDDDGEASLDDTEAVDIADDADDDAPSEVETPTSVEPLEFPPAPAAPDGLNDEAAAAWSTLVDEIEAGSFDTADVVALAEVGDVRHAWLLSDLLRFVTEPVLADEIVERFDQLAGTTFAEERSSFRSPWNETTNLLIAWDTPGPPDYRRLKGELFTVVEPKWAPFFAWVRRIGAQR